jgi:hypothetical protein
MNFLQNLTLKKSFIVFLICILLNLILISSIYYFQNYPKELNEYLKISDFVISKFEEKNIELTIKSDQIILGENEYFIESEGFPVELTKRNLIYISTEANYADFKEKDTIAILNNKELVLNLNNEFQNLPLESITPQNQEIILNKDSVRNFINQNYLENNQISYLMFGGFLLDRFLNYFIIFIWGYLIVGYLAFYILKFSGYPTEKNISQAYALIFASLYLLIQPIFYFIGTQINLIYVFLLGFLAVSFMLKKTSENPAEPQNS